MGRIVTIPLQTATTRGWTVDADTLLISMMASISGANAVSCSFDPSITGAQIIAAPAAQVGIISGLVAVILPNSAAFAQSLKIPLGKGQIVYLNSTVATFVFLLVEDVLPAVV